MSRRGDDLKRVRNEKNVSSIVLSHSGSVRFWRRSFGAPETRSVRGCSDSSSTAHRVRSVLVWSVQFVCYLCVHYGHCGPVLDCCEWFAAIYRLPHFSIRITLERQIRQLHLAVRSGFLLLSIAYSCKLSCFSSVPDQNQPIR